MTIARNDLPLDAVSVNGSYIEDNVVGYKTLKSVGREITLRDLSVVDRITDGSVLTNSRYPARAITVHFIIKRNSLANMRASMDSLKRVLDVTGVKFVFNGDSSYYYVGTPTLNEDISEGWNAIVGTYTINCFDPFRYSVAEYTQTAVGGQFSVTYNGTYKSYPTFITTFPSTKDANGNETSTNECGYVGFANQRENVLQFGDPNETDWGDVTYPATVPVNRTFKTVTGWTQNNTEVHTGTQVGTVASNGSGAYPSSYGSGSGWHGPSLSYIITGESTPISKDFNCTCSHKYLGTKAQFGGFELLLWNNNSGTRTLVCGIRIEKQTKDTNCRIFLYVYSRANKKYYDVPCSSVGTTSMKKVGSKVTFTVGGQTNTFAAPEISDLVANEISFHYAIKGTQTGLGANIVYNVKLQRLPFKNYEDIANIFSAGDVLTVDTQDAGVYLDDGSATIPAAYLGALGNDWEDFYLTPGANTIAVDYSDFTTTPPTFTIKYRERFL